MTKTTLGSRKCLAVRVEAVGVWNWSLASVQCRGYEHKAFSLSVCGSKKVRSPLFRSGGIGRGQVNQAVVHDFRGGTFWILLIRFVVVFLSWPCEISNSVGTSKRNFLVRCLIRRKTRKSKTSPGVNVIVSEVTFRVFCAIACNWSALAYKPEGRWFNSRWS
jgi:hypothetical protein